MVFNFFLCRNMIYPLAFIVISASPGTCMVVRISNATTPFSLPVQSQVVSGLRVYPTRKALVQANLVA